MVKEVDVDMRSSQTNKHLDVVATYGLAWRDN